MQQRIIDLKKSIEDKQHLDFRQEIEMDKNALAEEYADQQLGDLERAVRRFTYLMNNEQAVSLPGQRIVLMRTFPFLPEMHTPDERQALRTSHALYGLGRVSNVCVNYPSILSGGLSGKRRTIENRLRKQCTPAQIEFLQGASQCIDAISSLCGNYAMRASAAGDEVLAKSLRGAIETGAKSFREALQVVRIINFSLWAAGHYNNSLGRVDQYLLPYYEMDKRRGMGKEEALELVEEFFLSLTLDYDIYPAGGASQCMTLGGYNEKNVPINDLTLLFIMAALELKLPEPQLHIRVDGKTPVELYELSARLLKEVRTSPTFANDDIIIPGLQEYGYHVTDAQNYCIGADGAILIPGKSHDLHSVGAISMQNAVRNASIHYLENSVNMQQFLSAVSKEIDTQIKNVINTNTNYYFEPAPVLSLFMDYCLDEVNDIADGCLYNNYGIHASGYANAADTLSAIKKTVFDLQRVPAALVVKGLRTDFLGLDSLHQTFISAPKIGYDLDAADNMLRFLVPAFTENLRGLQNAKGGFYLPGISGFYSVRGGMPGGRYENTGVSIKHIRTAIIDYTLGPDAKQVNPVYQIQSFTKPDLKRMVTGGPFVLSLHNNYVSTEITKLLRLFVSRGGHFIQILFS